MVRAGIRMLADYEVKMRSLRQDIGAADAEIAAGRGKTYSSSAEILDEVMEESRSHRTETPDHRAAGD